MNAHELCQILPGTRREPRRGDASSVRFNLLAQCSFSVLFLQKKKKKKKTTLETITTKKNSRRDEFGQKPVDAD